MQLERAPFGLIAFVIACAIISFAASARAENHLDTRFTYFGETSGNLKIHVFHPQLEITGDPHPAVTLRAGYDADVVTGATPRTYGARSAIDVVSAATNFSDTRHAVHAGMEARVGRATLGANYTFATENDYRSHAIDVRAKVDLFGKNTTFALSYSHNFDSVCDVDNRGASPLARRSLISSVGCFTSKTLVEESLAIDSYALSWTQVLSPIVLGELSTSFEVVDGFQSNPYRRVRLFSGTVEAQESEPLVRERVAAQARLRIAVPKARAAVGVSGRYYWDTWGVQSGTVELSWEQYILPQLLIRVRGRFYQQGRALFYRDAGETNSYEAVGPVGQYFTGDRELSPLRDYLVGAKISYLKSAGPKGKIFKFLESVDLNLKVDVIGYENLSPQPPSAERAANFIDAIIAQAGVTLRW